MEKRELDGEYSRAMAIGRHFGERYRRAMETLAKSNGEDFADTRNSAAAQGELPL